MRPRRNVLDATQRQKKKRKLRTKDWARCSECKEMSQIESVALEMCRQCAEKVRREERGETRMATRPDNAVNKPLREAKNAQRRSKQHRPLVGNCLRVPETRLGKKKRHRRTRTIYTLGLYAGGGMQEKPYAAPPFRHVLCMDIDSRFETVLKANLRTTKFVQSDIRTTDPKKFPAIVRDEGKVPPGSHLHVNLSLCCKKASPAAGIPIDYEACEADIKHSAEIITQLGKAYIVTHFGEFIVNKRILTAFRRHFPDASISVVTALGEEKRLRVFIASGFSIEDIERLAAEKLAKRAKSVEAIIGKGMVRSNTGKNARFKPTAEGIGTITCTGYVYRDNNGKVEQVSKEKLLEIRSQGSRLKMDLSMVGECLGRVIVGQGVSLVAAEVGAELCAKAHLERW